MQSSAELTLGSAASSSSAAAIGQADESDGGRPTSDVDHHAADTAPVAENPGDFDHKEDEKGFRIHPAEGLNMVLQSTIGQPGPNSAAVIAQMGITSGGANTVWILTDQRSPTVQAVLQPGPEGKIIKLSSTARPIKGLSADGEVFFSAAAVLAPKISGKYIGDDFHAQLAVQPMGGMGGAPSNFELAYHQTLVPGITAGGSLQGMLGSVLPVPSIEKLMWGSFGSWRNQRGDRAVTLRLGQQPGQGGQVLHNFSGQYWHKASKNLELGSNINYSAHSLLEPASSDAGIGMRMSFEGLGGMNPNLTAHMSSNLVASVQYQKPFASPVSSTFMRTTFTGVFDHKNKDYKYGVGLECYY